MRSVERRGKSVEDAVRAALAELGARREDVEVDVLEEGSRGLFGLLAKEARVRVTVREPASREQAVAGADEWRETSVGARQPGKESGAGFKGDAGKDAREAALQLVAAISRAMGVAVTCSAREDGGAVLIEVNGDDVGALIGRRGQTLDALQYLVNLAANKSAREHKRIIVDAEGYRRRREETLRRLAVQLAERARRSGRDVVLEPMSAYERRIIHLELQNQPGVTTRSVGEEPYRKVVISVKK